MPAKGVLPIAAQGTMRSALGMVTELWIPSCSLKETGSETTEAVTGRVFTVKDFSRAALN